MGWSEKGEHSSIGKRSSRVISLVAYKICERVLRIWRNTFLFPLENREKTKNLEGIMLFKLIFTQRRQLEMVDCEESKTRTKSRFEKGRRNTKRKYTERESEKNKSDRQRRGKRVYIR